MLLIVLWVRSYWWRDLVTSIPTGVTYVASFQGKVTFVIHTYRKSSSKLPRLPRWQFDSMQADLAAASLAESSVPEGNY